MASREALPRLDGFSSVRTRRSEGRLTIEARLEADTAWCDGHFDGAPVFPAVGHVDVATRLARAAGWIATEAPVSLRGLRLRRPVKPPCELVVELDDRGAETVGFSILVESVPSSAGTLELPSGGEALERGIETPSSRRDRVDAGARIPHQRSARWVRACLGRDDRRVEVEASVPLAHPAVRDGRVASTVLFEVGAQAAALHEALRRAETGAAEAVAAARRGFVVRVPAWSAVVRDVPAGAALEARVELEGEAAPLARYRAEVRHAGRTVAHGAFSTYGAT